MRITISRLFGHTVVGAYIALAMVAVAACKGGSNNNSEQGEEEKQIASDKSVAIDPATTYIEFKDSLFRAYCIENFDENGDGQLSYLEASKVESIDVAFHGSFSDPKINSLAGIEHFANLKRLYCDNNDLGSIDLSKNINIEEAKLNNCRLTEVNVKGLIKLKSLNLRDNNSLERIDIGDCVALESLNCGYCNLSEIELSKNIALKELLLFGNKLQKIDITKNVELVDFSCSMNQLQVIDLSKNTALRELSCYDNPLTALDISNNLELWKLAAWNIYDGSEIKVIKMRKAQEEQINFEQDRMGMREPCNPKEEWEVSFEFVD